MPPKQNDYPGVLKIISGGQTGADKAGLVAAKILGLKTGGCCPKGCRTDTGPDLSLVKEYGLREHPLMSYPPRTSENVKNSDGTVIFGDTGSPGCQLTLDLCHVTHKKPVRCNPTKKGFRDFCKQYNIQVLNVAGNRESKSPGIFDSTVAFLVEALGGD